jgi:hypothetical protein
MGVELPFYACLILGGAVGSSHTQLLEGNKPFVERLKYYGFFTATGAILNLSVNGFCGSHLCQGHPFALIVYLIAAFLLGMGTMGLIVNVSNRGTQSDPDTVQRNYESAGIDLSASVPSYKPVAIEESEVL